MSDMTHTLGTLTPSPEPHPSHAGPLLYAPGQGSGLPSVCEALADRLALPSVFDVDIEVRKLMPGGGAS